MDPTGDRSRDAEFERVADLTAAGDLTGARAALRSLAERSLAERSLVERSLVERSLVERSPGERSDPYVAARALRLAATLDRALGDLDDAVATARRAAELAGTDDTLATEAYAELGRALEAQGRPAVAAVAYAKAADRAVETREDMLRLRARALAAAGRGDESARILTDLATGTDDPGARADLLVQAASSTGATDLRRKAQEAVDAAAGNGIEPAAEHAMRADLAFVAAASALDGGGAKRALSDIRAARRHALAANAVLRYIAAAVAESSIAELTGDDTAAYGSLATGYATLGDVVGRQLSASTFEGPLRTLRDRWGPDRFARAKRDYDDARRRARVD